MACPNIRRIRAVGYAWTNGNKNANPNGDKHKDARTNVNQYTYPDGDKHAEDARTYG